MNHFTGLLAPSGPEGLPDHSHAEHHDVIFHPSAPDLIYFASEGGVFRSLDGRQTFEGVNDGYQSQRFHNEFSSYATAHELRVAESTDGGFNFSDISPPELGGPGAFIAPPCSTRISPAPSPTAATYPIRRRR